MREQKGLPAQAGARMSRRRSRLLLVCALCAVVTIGAQAAACDRHDGTALRDVHWRQKQPPHPLIGQVFKGEQPIAVASDACVAQPAAAADRRGVGHDPRRRHRAARARCTTIPSITRCAATFSGRGSSRWCRRAACVRPRCSSTSAPASRRSSITSIARPPAAAACGGAPDLLRELDWENSRLAGGRDLLAAVRRRPVGEAADLSRQRRPRAHAAAGSRPGPSRPMRKRRSLKLAQAMPQPLLRRAGVGAGGVALRSCCRPRPSAP